MSAASQKSALTQFVKDRLAKLADNESKTDPSEQGEVINDHLFFLRGAQEALSAVGISAEDAAPVAKAVIMLNARLDLDEALRG